MPHVSLITLGVDDLDLVTRFYEDLGWRRSSASVPDVVSFLQGGNVALGLFGRASLAEEAQLSDAQTSGNGAVALAMNVPEEALVDAALQAAQDAGGRITSPAARAEWGGYSGYFTDPEGYLWEVAHNPFFPLSDDGTVELPE